MLKFSNFRLIPSLFFSFLVLMYDTLDKYNIKLSNDQIILFFKTIKKKNDLVKGKKETIKNLINNKSIEIVLVSFLILASNCLIDSKLHIFHYCLLNKVKFSLFTGNSKELGQLCDLKHKVCIIGVLKD